MGRSNEARLFRNTLPTVRRLALRCGDALGIAIESRTAVWPLITSVGDPQREAGENDGGDIHYPNLVLDSKV